VRYNGLQEVWGVLEIIGQAKTNALTFNLEGNMMNLTLELTTNQVIQLVKQMPPEDKRTVLYALAQPAHANRAARMNYAEAQLRRLAAEQGKDWETMTEYQREIFIDDLIHEDRACTR
jgi:hypothetical protein